VIYYSVQITVATWEAGGGGLSWVVGPWFRGDGHVAGRGDGPPVHHPR
jgi:hypothetical protein